MSTPDVLANLIQPNVAAAAFLRGKTPVSRAVFDKMLPELRARCFVVTGIEQANALQTIRDRVATLPEGADWNTVKKDIAETMSPWLGDESATRRADLLVRFHGFQAYQATQWNLDQETKDTHPYYQYRTAEDAHVRASHAALDGIILPIDDPFWKTHFPPWDWGCRCELIAISEADHQEARARDAELPPDQRQVLDGARLDQLRQGYLINGPSARIDIRSDHERGTPGALQWKPGDLRITPDELQQRYDSDVWTAFTKWAESTALDETGKTSVWEWMNGAKLATSKTVSVSARIMLDDPKTVGALDWMPKPAAKRIVTEEATLTDPEHEQARVFDHNGHVLHAEEGDLKAVTMPVEKARLARAGTVSHTHPEGGTFSIDDLKFAYTYRVKELRAIAPEGTYVMMATGKQFDPVKFRNVQLAWSRLITGITNKDTAAAVHKMMKTIAKENGFVYGIVPGTGGAL